ncbi:LOW QUALITY PROTEIN: RING finger protein nhl-1 [Daphnia magna]|uniref:LOW QUALITY PROTEIN: RING finger protein nhl-1 n=1 Tax=Daphnia magna TaxID=35525 RepID=UPI001E1BB068|nr:LOW QUALITY PROTEIN: RING finger protein nhl-1 [Daphnia magna]
MEQFDQLLTCCVCLDRYRNPKLLPCQHSFCMEPCMEGLINYVTRQVKCPECRAEHRIPYQGIAAYPTNVTLQRFLELHIEITGELPDPTSGQVMERCGVCSEKNYCTLCCHCDKKVCADCKEGHLDILRREIARINNQVRRTLPRLQDALGVIDKNSNQLEVNCRAIVEEVDGLYRRLSKALKDRTDFIKSEIEVFMAKELKALKGLRANLEHEISNFDSNSEFAEKHVTAGTSGTDGGSSSTSTSSSNTVCWDDNELMDTKDIFLRTMEFIRNFETETGDYHRRVRFFVPQDPNQLSNTLANLGELTILAGPSSSSSGPYQPGPPQPPSLGPGLMRSKSDHRVAAQFRQQEERYNAAYGSDNNDDLGGGSGRPRYFGERHGSISTRAVDRYDTSSRRNDYGDYEEPSDIGRRKFRSRFMRHHDSGDSDNEPAGRSVRFQAGETGTSDSAANKKERQRVLDTEDAARGPLSGITRLSDSPRVIKRLQEVGRKKKATPPSTLNLSTPAAPVHQSLASPSRVPPRPTAAARQVSEEDEIAKIKKQNKGQEASADGSTRKADGGASVPSTSTGSADRPRFTSQQNSSSTEQQKAPSASRQTSTTSASEKPTTESATSSGATPAPETAEEARTRRRSLLASTKSGTPSETESSSRQTTDRTPIASSYAAAVASRTSSPADDSSDRLSRRVGRVSTERFNKSSSESSTSAESSTHSSPVRNTGAAFSTVELKNRFGGGISAGRKSSTGSTNGDASASMATTATRSRFGNTSGGATSPSSGAGRFGSSSGTASSAATTSVASSNGTAAGVAPHRFQSRFLGRAGTPTAEASRGSENSQSSSSDDSSDSSESDSADKPATGKNAAVSKTAVAPKPTTTPAATKDRELARTDIGPLLARSAQARDTSTYPSSISNSNHTSASSAGNSRPTTTSDSPSSYTPRSRATAASTASTSSSSRPYSSTSRYGTDSTTTGSALSRSRTGSALADDMENKYPLTSKYLNRSRANLSSDTGGYGADSGGYHGSSSSASSSTPRYSQTRGYQSRFLNKSKSSAALDCAPDDNNEMVDDDEDNVDDNGDDNSKSSAPSAASASSASQPLLVVSGDERYPSGRSRYAALKDRRSRLARSKSSHDVGPPASLGLAAPSSSSNELTVGDGGVGAKATDPHYYGQLGGEVGDTGTSSLEPTSPTAEAGSGSSLSTWARYLKNKYGPRNKEGEGQNQQPSSTTNSDPSAAGGSKQQQQAHPASRFSRARSTGVSGNNAANGRNDSDEITGPSSGLITSSSRHQYMQKRKVLMKIGTRGSEAGSFTWPRGVAVAPDNSIVVADSSNHRVQVFDSTGHFLKEFGYYGNGEGEFDCLAGVAINRIGQYIIADRYNHRIQVFDPSGRFLRVFGSQGTSDGKFSYPWGVTTDALGFIYVCDKENHRVQVFQSDGTFVGKFGTMGNRPGQLEHPHYIAVSSTNRVIVSDSNNHRIQVFDVNGKVIATFGVEGADEGQFKFPRGVAVDDQGYIVVADSGNNRIQVFTADGVFVKAFGCWGCGDGEFKGLEGIAVMSNGNIVCADRENHRIQVF